MNILLTGSDGYIGTVTSQALLQAGHEVVGLDTGFYRNGWLFNHVSKLPSVVNKDVRQVTVEELAGYEAVIHMAELSNDPMGQNNPEATYAASFLGTLEFAKKCKAAGVKKFVYMSSCSVYGIAQAELVTETSPLNPQTMYAKCKMLVEQEVSKLGSDNFSPTFLRNATVYGASPRMRFDLVVNNLAGLAWTSKVIALSSDGTPWRPLVHIADVAEAIICVLNSPKESVHNQIFNVGGDNYRIRDIAQIIAEVFPDSNLTIGNSDGDTRSYKVSFAKIKQQLPAFKCRWDVKKGAQELKNLFARIDLSKELFEYEAYTRIKQLQHLLKTGQIDENFYWKSL